MRRGDVQEMGLWSLQHFDRSDPAGVLLDERTRHLVFASRIEYVQNTYGIWQEDNVPKTLGPVLGGICWPAEDGTSRRMSEWSWAFPVQVDTAADESGGTTSVEDSAGKFRPAHSADKDGWALNSPSLGKLGALGAFWFDGKQAWPKNYPGLVVAATDLGSQQAAWVPSGSLLVAPHRGGTERMGTLVWDVDPDTKELDKKRRAHLQSLTRVYLRPPTCANHFGKPGEPSLALQGALGKAGIGGRVVIADTPASPPTLGLAVQGPDSPSSAQALAGFAKGVSGPLQVGAGFGDKHFLGANEDGESFASGHLDTSSYFFMDGERDAPLAFSILPWPDAGEPSGQDVECFISYDPKITHPFACGAKPGMWRIWTRVPIRKVEPPDSPYNPPPGDDPRTVIPPPPSDPDNPYLVVPTEPTGGLTIGGGGTFVPPTSDPVVINEPTRTPTGSGLGTPPEYTTYRFPGVDYTYPSLKASDAPAPQYNTYRFPGVDYVSARAKRYLNLSYLQSPNELALPGLIFRPQSFSRGVQDLRNNLRWSESAARATDRTTPVVGRLESIGVSVGPNWTYTRQPGAARYPGGTAEGITWFMPPEVGLEQVFDGNVPTDYSHACLGFYLTCISFGTPTETGKSASGYTLSQVGSAFQIGSTTATGASSDTVMALNAGAGTGTLFGNTIVRVNGSPSSGQIPVADGAGSYAWSSAGTSSWFGNGAMGAVDLDGSNTYASYSKSGSTYTQLNDVVASTLTVRNGTTLKTQGYRTYCSTSLTVESGGVVQNNGSNGSGTSGGAGGPSGTLAGGAAGANGRTSLGDGTAGTSLTNSIGGDGGGGQSSLFVEFVGGAGGTATAPASSAGAYKVLPQLQLGLTFGTSTLFLNGGASGGSGANGSGSGGDLSGGGGGGGGIVVISAKTITNNGTIKAFGGNGANGVAAPVAPPLVQPRCGGGGGGGGGAIGLVYGSYTGSGTLSAAGGSAGTGSDGGTGTAGASGTTIEIQV